MKEKQSFVSFYVSSKNHTKSIFLVSFFLNLNNNERKTIFWYFYVSSRK